MNGKRRCNRTSCGTLNGAALDINRKQSEIISAQARTIEELRGTIVELNASLAWLKRKVFGKMSEKCKPVDNGDPKLPFDYGDLEQIEAEIEDARSRAAEQITVPKSRAANKTPRRNRVVMNNLPVVTVVIEPENVDLSRYVKIGEEHTRTLEDETRLPLCERHGTSHIRPEK